MQKMVQLPLRIEKSVIDSIDEIVRSSSDYRSRSDYIRKKLYQDIEEERLRKLIKETGEELKKEAIRRGAKPGLPTRAERIRIANEFLKEKGLKY